MSTSAHSPRPRQRQKRLKTTHPNRRYAFHRPNPLHHHAVDTSTTKDHRAAVTMMGAVDRRYPSFNITRNTTHRSFNSSTNAPRNRPNRSNVPPRPQTGGTRIGHRRQARNTVTAENTTSRPTTGLPEPPHRQTVHHRNTTWFTILNAVAVVVDEVDISNDDERCC